MLKNRLLSLLTALALMLSLVPAALAEECEKIFFGIHICLFGLCHKKSVMAERASHIATAEEDRTGYLSGEIQERHLHQTMYFHIITCEKCVFTTILSHKSGRISVNLAKKSLKYRASRV